MTTDNKKAVLRKEIPVLIDNMVEFKETSKNGDTYVVTVPEKKPFKGEVTIEEKSTEISGVTFTATTTECTCAGFKRLGNCHHAHLVKNSDLEEISKTTN